MLLTIIYFVCVQARERKYILVLQNANGLHVAQPHAQPFITRVCVHVYMSGEVSEKFL